MVRLLMIPCLFFYFFVLTLAPSTLHSLSDPNQASRNNPLFSNPSFFLFNLHLAPRFAYFNVSILDSSQFSIFLSPPPPPLNPSAFMENRFRSVDFSYERLERPLSSRDEERRTSHFERRTTNFYNTVFSNGDRTIIPYETRAGL